MPKDKKTKLISLDHKWRRAISNNTLVNGIEYYRMKRAIITEYNVEEDGLTVDALVNSLNSRNAYEVNFSINSDGEITGYDCNCPAKYNGLCKHCVAALMQYEDECNSDILTDQHEGNDKNLTNDTQNAVDTIAVLNKARWPNYMLETESERKKRLEDERMESLLKMYKQLSINEIKDIKSTEEHFVTLIPILDISQIKRGIFLSFQIRRKGETIFDLNTASGKADEEESNDEHKTFMSIPSKQYPRAYVISKLDVFLSSFDNHKSVIYGKELSYDAFDSSFDETSIKWLKYLRQCDNEYKRNTAVYNPMSAKQIKLQDDMLDELFEQFGDVWFRKKENSDDYYKRISYDEPALEIELSEAEDGSLKISCPQLEKIYFGFKNTIIYEFANSKYAYVPEINITKPPRYIYVKEGEALCRYSFKASAAIAPLLLALLDKGGTLAFSNRQQIDDIFCHLLPEVSKYLKVSDPMGLFEKHRPDTMMGKILLDAPEKERVTAILLSGYNGIWLNMYTGQAVGQTVDDEKGSSPVKMNWDASGLDSSGIKRDFHAEQRFLAQACGIFGFDKGQIINLLKPNESGSIVAGSPAQPLTISGSDAIYKLLTDGIIKLKELGNVLVTKKMRNLTVEPPTKVSVGVTLDSGLLKLDIDSGGFPIGELQALISAYRERKLYYRLKNGAFVDFSKVSSSDMAGVDELSKVSQGLQIDDYKSGSIEVPAFRAMYLDGLFSDAVSLISHKDRAFESLTARIRDFAHADFAIPNTLEDILRPYQQTGYKWLRCLETCSFCGILADDMGLGKSVQLISVLLAYYHPNADISIKTACNGDSGDERALPSLIVCPSSLVLNWRNEIRKFAPMLSSKVIQGSLPERIELIKSIKNDDIVITSYDLLKRDVELYKNTQFYYCAIDEAQYIKNHSTQAAKAVKKIVCRQRCALTGTPIENRLSELWSIFDFLMPGYLYRYTRFRERFELPITRDSDEAARENLRRMIRPFILRRLKSEVLKELPPKNTAVVPIELNDKHMEAYRAMLLTGLDALKGENRPEGVAKMQVLALLTKLRRLCCDPSLCFDNFKYESSKLEVCMELLNQAKEGDHRVLLFSQYTDMLDLIEARVKTENMSYLRLQGSTNVKERLNLVDKFNQGETDVFLISLKAGGTGLNLTAADTVIHYDPWWNTAAQDQATDRAHRIGQEKPVQVYKLIAQDTIEEKILKLQEMKKDLASIIESDKEEGSLLTMSSDEIIDLLMDR